MNTENIPKKRGRKPKPKIENEESVKIPKKRGRKPKKIDENKIVKIPKKRGRKPKEKFGIISDHKLSVITEENIILHLPIKNITNNNPKPFNNSSYEEYDFFENNDVIENDLLNTNILENNESKINIFEDTKLKDIELYPKNELNINEIIKQRKNEILYDDVNSNIFLEFIEANKNQKWPKTSSINCLWDCHSFDNQPYGIPIKKVNNTYYMFGNFCSPECAAAYNFNNNNDNNVWERYSLLNNLYNNNHPLFISNSHLLLKEFGGKYTIEEFRKKNSNKTNIKIIHPPFISNIPSIEEINYDIDINFSNINKNKLHKFNNDYILKRSKPLPEFKNTLESSMNLKYV